MKERDEALQTSRMTKDPNDRLLYKNLRNTVTNLIRKEKKVWEQRKLDHSRNDPESIWKNVKTWLGWGNNGPPTKLLENGKVITSPKTIAESMNNFFANKIEHLKDNIPASTDDPCAKLREVMKDRICSFSFQPVGPDEVEKIVLNLKNTKSTGIDSINTITLKLALPYILPALTHIVNLSLSQSKFPEGWKKAKVVPLLKKDDPMISSNYRPVSNLLVTSKVLEKVVLNKLVTYL